MTMCTAIHTMYHDDSICKILCLAPPSAGGVSSHVRSTCTCCDTCGIKPAGQCSAVETVVYVSSDLFDFTVAEHARVGNLRYFALLTVFLCSSVNLNSFTCITSLCLSSVLGYCFPGELSDQVAAAGQTTYRQISHPSHITRGELHLCDRVSACLRCILSLIS